MSPAVPDSLRCLTTPGPPHLNFAKSSSSSPHDTHTKRLSSIPIYNTSHHLHRKSSSRNADITPYHYRYYSSIASTKSDEPPTPIVIEGYLSISVISQQIYAYSPVTGPNGPQFVLHLGPEVIPDPKNQLLPSNLIHFAGVIAGEIGRSLHIIVHSLHLYSICRSLNS
ncbi:hypothetical protein PtA15_9A447 [Puccinia triticina]|uniref:Uncharacterized protein n=1 Tax=Puccinia triticina TaxID=208348 RepID=A0ABY7CUI1_9BASI|nr:uncharacterized protein PtA15_9A447 [Puccinia triticina]WAQ88320.1 hypothetical protein PtA15_9A447 [Puccinia triticina]WAR60498.1 hypothetical protein PtB15_9B437 [Puccinia triticina]